MVSVIIVAVEHMAAGVFSLIPPVLPDIYPDIYPDSTFVFLEYFGSKRNDDIDISFVIRFRQGSKKSS